ncbi:MAG: HNH endonuclease signature motif containing protein [Patescibacteria group bacterium]
MTKPKHDAMMKRSNRFSQGMKFKRLTLLEKFREDGRTKWKCRCECGVEKTIRSTDVKRLTSCGCYNQEMRSRPHGSIQQRIVKFSDYDAKTECWNWIGAKNGSNYGQMGMINSEKKFKTMLAHRISYQEFIGEIPCGLFICHKCDNPSCVNPEHLFCGSHQDNIDDRERKGRNGTVLGEKNPNCKHSKSDILEIRSLYKSGISSRKLAKMFGYKGHQNILRIVSGKSWKNL